MCRKRNRLSDLQSRYPGEVFHFYFTGKSNTYAYRLLSEEVCDAGSTVARGASRIKHHVKYSAGSLPAAWVMAPG